MSARANTGYDGPMSPDAYAVPRRRPLAVYAVGAIAIAACSTPRFDDCEVRCLESGVCPSGLECGADGYCYAEGGGATGTCAERVDAGAQGERDGGDDVSGPAERVEVGPLAEPVDIRRREPEPVTSCISGGLDGRDVAYSEAEPDVHARDLIFPSYDEALARELELPDDPSQLELDILASFDVDPSGAVSSADGVEVLSTSIPGGQFGVFYRQAIEIHHGADLFAITATGDDYKVGEVAVKDWRFVADLGIGESCPPLPPPPSTLE